MKLARRLAFVASLALALAFPQAASATISVTPTISYNGAFTVSWTVQSETVGDRDQLGPVGAQLLDHLEGVADAGAGEPVELEDVEPADVAAQGGGADGQRRPGHESLNATELYTRVSIRKLKEIHTATHPSARLERKEGQDGAEEDPEVERAEMLARLDEEADEDGEDGGPELSPVAGPATRQ